MKRLLLLLISGPALAMMMATASAATFEATDPRDVQIADDADLGDIIMDEVERRLIRGYYSRNYHDYVYTGSGKNKGIPPGLAKKGWLPPGIAMQIARGQRIPDDVVYYRLPDDLRGQLPRRAGYEYYILDDKVLLVREATNLILDVLTVTAIEALD
ncbi:MAG: hypothetical protein SGJ07_16815 [Rhodospirillaceae bacterium]|nr:hypothetical protein [Rhodospirillaceae bacterium]